MPDLVCFTRGTAVVVAVEVLMGRVGVATVFEDARGVVVEGSGVEVTMGLAF